MSKLTEVLDDLTNPRRRVSPSTALRALYNALPKIQCKGLCWDSCGPIRMSPWEHRQTAEAGVVIPPGRFIRDAEGRPHGTVCPALNEVTLRCEVYEARPMICRIWGLTEGLRCPHGCEPEGGFEEDMDTILALNFAGYYGGDPDAEDPVRVVEHYRAPGVAAALKKLLEGSRPVKDEATTIRNGVIINSHGMAAGQ